MLIKDVGGKVVGFFSRLVIRNVGRRDIAKSRLLLRNAGRRDIGHIKSSAQQNGLNTR